MARSIRNVNIYPADDMTHGSIIITFYAEAKGDEFEVWVYIDGTGQYTKVQWWFNDGNETTPYDAQTITNIMDFLAGRWAPGANNV